MHRRWTARGAAVGKVALQARRTTRVGEARQRSSMPHGRMRAAKDLLRVPTSLACHSYEELRVQSAVLAYVVGEGHHDQTILELAMELSPATDSDAVGRAVRDLVGEALLTIDGGK